MKPSDEEIMRKARGFADDPRYQYSFGFGAKWMREEIKKWLNEVCSHGFNGEVNHDDILQFLSTPSTPEVKQSHLLDEVKRLRDAYDSGFNDIVVSTQRIIFELTQIINNQEP